MNKRTFLYALIIGAILQSCYYDNQEDLYQYVQEQDCNATTATFSADIAPILAAHCNRCHRNGREDGAVNLEGFSNVKPYADAGSLYGTANHAVGYPVMPTDGVKIPFCEIEKMRIWIANGALND